MLILFLFVFIPIVNAEYNPSYYVTNEKEYVLCPTQDTRMCFSIQRNEKGAIFNIKENQISYNGITYVFSEDFQKIYDSSQQSQIKNVYYINKKGNYAICDSLDACYLYTYNDLATQANIVAGVSVTLNGKTYYYNAEVQQEVNNGKDPGKVIEDYTKKTSGNNGNNANNENEESTKPPKVEEEPKTDYCTVRLKEPLKFIGRVVLIVKIIIPIIIVIFGVLDFFKAVTAAKDDEIKKSGRSLALRVLAGVVIFLIPTIVSVVFSMVDSWMNIKGDFNACQKCIFRVSECE